jgi:para-aminobenzoate synthetase
VFIINPELSIPLAAENRTNPSRMPSPKNLLFIDAYDSFSENIAALIRRLLAVKITIIRVDSWTVHGTLNAVGEAPPPNLQPVHGGTQIRHDTNSQVRKFNLRTGDFELLLEHYDAVVVGPGPGDPRNPADLGIVSLLWKAAERCRIPVLGICLGFQSLCLAYGASIVPLSEPCHGHAESVLHDDHDIFAHVGQVIATNYHSLEVRICTSKISSLSSYPSSARSSFSDDSDDSEFQKCPDIQQLAWNEKGTLMAARHTSLPFWGLQFHPESCRSNTACHDLVRNWWKAAMESSATRRQSSHLEISLSDNRSYLTVQPRVTGIRDEALPTEKDALPVAECWSSCNVKDEQAFRDELQHLTRFTGEVVASHKVQEPVHVRDIAELCQRLSHQRAVAVLESTKKGRFCIYAMPSPDDFRLEYFEEDNFTSLTYSSPMQTRHYCVLQKEGAKTAPLRFVTSDVMQNVQQVVESRKAQGGQTDSPFWGGFIGYLSYEMGLGTLRRAKNRKLNPPSNPDMSLQWVQRSIVVDKLTGTTHVQSIRKGDFEWISTMVRAILCLEPTRTLQHGTNTPELAAALASARIALPDENDYKRNIKVCQSHLRAGSSYELCLTTEAQITLPSTQSIEPWLLYRRLQKHNPAPFSAYLSLGKTKILSSSPEQFLVWDRNCSIDMIPMKGTVSKSDPSMTLAKASAILASPKESAENLMIADLIRHDLYSTVGSLHGASVEVVRLCDVVEHETVFQLVSHIRAKPPIPAQAPDDEKRRQVIHYGHKALRQCIPPGSMTGAPKKRSCEILCELERRPRGVYSGVLGYLDVGGGGAFNVCIRTAYSHHDDDRDGMRTWRVGAGGAITVLSDVDAEWEEMRTKLDSTLRAFRPD